ncbi:hypothetical protein JCM13210_14760 [Thermaerobacter litoralis]
MPDPAPAPAGSGTGPRRALRRRAAGGGPPGAGRWDAVAGSRFPGQGNRLPAPFVGGGFVPVERPSAATAADALAEMAAKKRYNGRREGDDGWPSDATRLACARPWRRPAAPW